MTSLVERAKELACRAHAGQVDKAGRPYIEHVARVAERVREDGRCTNDACNGRGEIVDWDSVGCSDPSCCSPASRPCPDCDEAEAVAWLHDVGEDKPEYYVRIGELMPYSVVVAVQLLDRNIAGDYHGRIRANPIAMRVKLADIADNADESRLALLDAKTADRLRRKYQRALEALSK